MLIPFPFAFLAGALVFDVLGRWLGDMDLAYTGRNLTIAGIAAGLLAAIPGVIDYLGSVPPASSGKRRASMHAAANVGALALFFVSLQLRDDGAASVATLATQLAGLTLLSAGGYMGGTLVYRNQIGVDHRYAGAGRWKEIAGRRTGDRIVIEEPSELQVNQMALAHADGARIVLARTEGGYRAFDDRCPHKGGPLSDGVLICGTVQCPWHGSQFDVGTGEVKCGPAAKRIRTHDVERSNRQLILASGPRPEA